MPLWAPDFFVSQTQRAVSHWVSGRCSTSLVGLYRSMRVEVPTNLISSWPAKWQDCKWSNLRCWDTCLLAWTIGNTWNVLSFSFTMCCHIMLYKSVYLISINLIWYLYLLMNATSSMTTTWRQATSHGAAGRSAEAPWPPPQLAVANPPGWANHFYVSQRDMLRLRSHP